MKKGLQFLVLVLLASCSDEVEQKPERVYACPQKMELLKATGGLPVKFDFGLSVEEEVEYFRNQVGFDFCHSIEHYSVDFQFTDGTAANAQIMFEQDCPEDSSYMLVGCFNPWTTSVLVNRNSQILVEGHYCTIDSLSGRISKSITNSMLEHNNGKVMIELAWDDGCPALFMSEVFDKVLRGYLSYSDVYSNQTFAKDVCLLDSAEVIELKDEVRLIFSVSELRTGPPPPPPPR